MSNIIKFPHGDSPPVSHVPPPVEAEKPVVTDSRGKRIVSSLVRFIWVVTVLVWPFLKWILSIHVFFLFVRMIYHWNTPGEFAGWTFALHFAVLTALTYFVSLYKPKGI